MLRVLLLLTLFMAWLPAAQPPLERVKPREPDAELKSFSIVPGFRVELVAAEPLVQSPVAIDWDEHGAMYVAEYPEYNQYANPKFQGKGRIRRLVDVDGDGRYESVTTFADNLDTPCALIVVNGGLYVGAPPDLWFLKDANGDGVADVRRKVLTGFGRDAAGEAMLNSFRWTLDGKILISTGHVGGDLKNPNDPNAKPMIVRRQNILLDPRTERFDLTSGGGQHGLTLSDWGDQFVCDNAHPIQNVQYDARDLVNPHVEAPAAVVNVHPFGSQFKLFRISPPEPWRVERTKLRTEKKFYGSDEGGQPFGFFTGATGVTIYRGDAWPAECRGQTFVGDVANNLIYRANLKRDGLHWKASRADEGREFFASNDIWFRPVQFANGPDGNLYVVDMYRELIECASCLPDSLLKGVNVSGGIDRGRIWRIVADGTKRKPFAKPGAASVGDLIAMLDHRNGWHRDTAARLLLEQQNPKSANHLRELIAKSVNPLTRTTARYVLAGQGQLFSREDAGIALSDPDNAACIHALRLAVPHLTEPTIALRIAVLVADADPRVRRQVAVAAGQLPTPKARPLLATLARRDAGDPLLRLAILSSSGPVAGELFAELLKDEQFRNEKNGFAFLQALLKQIGAAVATGQLESAIAALDALPQPDELLRRKLVASLLAKLPSKALPRLGSGATKQLLDESLSEARANAANEQLPVARRLPAISMLRLVPWEDARPILGAGLSVRQPPAVQRAMLEISSSFDVAKTTPIIIAAWPSLAPPGRAATLESLLSTKSGTEGFLTAVESKRIPAGELDSARMRLLLTTLEEPLKSRAAKLFAFSKVSSRKDVIEKYQPTLQNEGNVKNGKAVFKKTCSACHKLDGVGTDIGPDLSAVAAKSSEELLVSILDPNREVLPKYLAYKVADNSGTTATGLIVGETATHVTIRRSDTSEVTFSRKTIDEMKSTGLSAMPEGLESEISLSEMVDLLAYLKAKR